MTKVDKAWGFLRDNNYFTYKELELVTNLNGYTMNTLNDACEVRFGEGLEQLGFREDNIRVRETTKNGKDLDIKVWYTTVYALDGHGEYLNNVTFYELFNCLDRGEDVYEFLGVDDSVVRERVFIQLAFIMGVDYDYIYNQWLLTV